MTHILIDLANTYMRAKFITRGTIDEKIGMCLHVTLESIRKSFMDFNGSHVVFCLDGRSWRKDFYNPYKRNRHDAKALLTSEELEEDRQFWESFNYFQTFLIESTNSTVLFNPMLEADDLVSGWIQQHPKDEHVIISTDSDYAQLIAPNVCQYNGISEVTTKLTGYYDKDGDEVIDKKTKIAKGAPNPEWIIFEKCMRGDSTDNVFSAYPGVRTKGTKNKVGLQEAFEDRHSKGWAWNNMMLQVWTDHENKQHRVLDDYNRNVILCDLKSQPNDVKEVISNTVTDAVNLDKKNPNLGFKFAKLCAKYNLKRIGDYPDRYIEALNARYTSNG